MNVKDSFGRFMGIVLVLAAVTAPTIAMGQLAASEYAVGRSQTDGWDVTVGAAIGIVPTAAG